MKDNRIEKIQKDAEAEDIRTRYIPAREAPVKFFTDRDDDGDMDCEDEKLYDDDIDPMLQDSDPRWCE